MDGKQVARGGITVAETLLKYGLIQGSGMVIRCGTEAAGVMVKEAGSLASYFSGCSLGSGIGDFMLKKSQEVVNTGTKTLEKGSIFLLKKAADKARNGLS